MFSRTHLAIFFIVLSACKEKVAENHQRQLPQIIEPVNNSLSDKARSVLDKSPMDMIYLPDDYPVLKMSGKTKELPVARVIYSRPIKDGRSIFGNVVKYGSYWRLGANESTEIEFFKDVVIAEQKVKKGRYIIYCIPFKDTWKIRLNNDLYTWGLKVHDTDDIYSFEIPTTALTRDYDVFTMQFANTGSNSAELLMVWDNVKAALPISY